MSVRTRTSSIMIPAFVAPGGAPTLGLINFWPMTDAQVIGATINDTVDSNPGTAHNGIASAAGPNGTFGTGRSVDGVGGSYIGLSSPFAWNSGSFSFSGWVYLTDNSLTEGANRVTFFSDDIAGDGATNYIRILNNTSVGNGALAVNVSDNGGSTGVASAAGSVPNTTWTHFVYTNSGGGAGGTKKLYINGSAVSTSASTAGGAGGIVTAFGALDTAVGVIGGRICAYRLYNRVLTPTDVSTLFSAGG